MKKLICVLLALAMLLSMAMVATASGTVVDYVVVAGESSLCSSNWNSSDRSNEMTLSGAEYVKVYEDVAAGTYNFKVVVNYTDGNPDWIGDDTGNNVSFTVTAACDVTISYDPTTGDIEVTGANVGETAFEVEQIVAVGNGDGNWLNGANWDPAADANVMTEVSDGVYQITYQELPIFDNYQFKFAANGTWADSWGGTITASGEVNDAVYNGINITFAVEEVTDVTIALDLTNFDYASKSGATFTVTIGDVVTGPTLIDNVEITGVEAPVYGVAPDYTYELPENAGYVEYEAIWAVGDTMPEDYLDVDGNMLWYYSDEGMRFKTGKYYCFIAMLEPAEGYDFTPGVTATINGQEAWVDYASNGWLYVYLPFDALDGPAMTEIDLVDVFVDAPTVGGTASWDFTVAEDGGYAGASVISEGNCAWIVLDEEPTSMEDIWYGDVYLDDGTELVFEEGKCYVFAVYLEAEEGYEFADWVMALVNKGFAVTEFDGDLLFVAYSFGILEDLTIVDNVEVNGVTPPSIGAEADFNATVSADAGYELISEDDVLFSVWLVGDTAPTSFEDLIERDFFNNGESLLFEEGKYYTFVTVVAPKEGYGIPYNATATVNGKEALVQYLEGILIVTYTFEPLSSDVVIESVEITDVTAPALGAGANWNFTAPEGVGYAPVVAEDEVLSAWAMGDTKPADLEAVMAQDGFLAGDELTFGAGKYYTFVGVLLHEEGYEFSDNLTATVNGKEAIVMVIDGVAYVAYTFEPLTEENEGGDDENEGNPGTGDLSIAAVAVALMAATAGAVLTIGKKKEF